MRRSAIVDLRSEPVLLVMAAIAGTAPWTAIPDPWMIPVAIIGAATAYTAILAGRRFTLAWTETAALAMALLIVVGGFIAGPIPTLGAYRKFLQGLTSGWADLLTSIPPVPFEGQYRVLPFVIAWAACLAAIVLANLVSSKPVAPAGPITVFGCGLLLGTSDPSPVRFIQGALFLTLWLVLIVTRNPSESTALARTSPDHKVPFGRLIRSMPIIAALVLGASAFTVSFPGFGGRFDLRQHLVPPWDPLDEPSPLAQMKANYLDENRETVAFTATGDQLPKRWRLATMAHYDGAVWTVGTSELNGLARFVAVDQHLPPSSVFENDSNPGQKPETITVTIQDLEGPWLPTAGQPVNLTIDRSSAGTADAEESPNPISDIKADPINATIAAPRGAAGLAYQLQYWSSPAASDAPNVEANQAPPIELQSAAFLNQAADLLEGIDQGWPQVEAIRNDLKTNGYYKADLEARPGHSWTRLDEFYGADKIYGFEEQYAALAGVIARNADLPVRVVVGYIADPEQPTSGTVEIRREQAAAWIEIETTEYGWVPVDVTPDRDKEPDLKPEDYRVEYTAQPNPPTPPPEQETLDPDETEDEEDDEEEESEPSIILRIAVVAGSIIAIPSLLIGGWLGLMIYLKKRRAKNRKKAESPPEQIIGAWQETGDRFAELGVVIPQNQTIRQTASMLAGTDVGTGTMIDLGDVVEKAMYGPDLTNQADVDKAWFISEKVDDTIKANSSRVDRLVQKANPAPLLRR